MSERIEGWAWPVNSRKAHYYRGNGLPRSLCGKYALWGGEFFDEENVESSDNCAKCKRKRLLELASSLSGPAHTGPREQTK